jgi:2-polyprenyl-6-methoxyphenol hydroxylase-like FAD-dependent oxidoreductase
VSRHALVVGGGVAGLLAAHALAPVFTRVTVLERHPYPTPASPGGAPVARRGVPQARCLHLLAAAGGLAVDALVPGWRARAQALGALPFDASADTALCLPQGWMPRAPSGMTLLACSRQLLEDVLRQALLERPGTALRTGPSVRGLWRAHGEGSVRGLFLDREEEPLHADLVVDASGAASALPAWLGQAVPETCHRLGLHYLSRWLQLPEGLDPGWHCLSIAPTAASGRRSAMLLRAEHGHWGVVLLVPDGAPLPQTDAEFLAFTQGLGGGVLHALLARSTPASPIHRLGTTDSRLRRFETLNHWPQGLVVLGDAACRLDPYHGLGMTLAARAALLLRQHLQAGAQAGLPDCATFQQALAEQNSGAWEQATRLHTDGRPLQRSDGPLQRLVARATTDTSAAHALLAWQQLMHTEDQALEALSP